MGSVLGEWIGSIGSNQKIKKELMNMETVLMGVFTFCVIGIITVLIIVIYLICMFANWIFELFDFNGINNLLS